MAALAKRRMRRKIPLLEQALTGLMRDHYRRLLAIQLAHIDFLDEQIEALSTAIAARLAALSAEETASAAAGAAQGASLPTAPEAPPVLTFTRAVALLDTIPGVDRRGAELMLAEIGIDMTRFETAPRLAAWAGVAPGNNKSAGKQRSSTTQKGNQALLAGLTQLAQAAARTKETYLSALYGRLAARRGKQRAIMAYIAADSSFVLTGPIWMRWHQRNGADVSATCQHFGISRATLYRWLARYRQAPHTPLRRQSCRPKSPRTPGWTVGHLLAVAQVTHLHPAWGRVRV